MVNKTIEISENRAKEIRESLDKIMAENGLTKYLIHNSVIPFSSISKSEVRRASWMPDVDKEKFARNCPDLIRRDISLQSINMIENYIQDKGPNFLKNFNQFVRIDKSIQLRINARREKEGED